MWVSCGGYLALSQHPLPKSASTEPEMSPRGEVEEAIRSLRLCLDAGSTLDLGRCPFSPPAHFHFQSQLKGPSLSCPPNP